MDKRPLLQLICSCSLNDNDMSETHNDLGRVIRLKADAVGEPGERRFRLVAEFPGGRSAVMWMEKEQLFQLGTALQELVAEAQDEGRAGGDASSPVEQSHPEPGPRLEFQVSRIAVRFDPQVALFVIAAYEEEESEDSLPTVQLTATRQEAVALAEEALAVCAAGRPLCDLCGAPMEKEFHMCPSLSGDSGLLIL